MRPLSLCLKLMLGTFTLDEHGVAPGLQPNSTPFSSSDAVEKLVDQVSAMGSSGWNN